MMVNQIKCFPEIKEYNSRSRSISIRWHSPKSESYWLMHAWCWIWASFETAEGRSLRGQQVWHKCRQRALPLSLTGLVSGRRSKVFVYVLHGSLLGHRHNICFFPWGVGDDLKMNREYLLSALPVNLHFLSIPTPGCHQDHALCFCSVSSISYKPTRLIQQAQLGCWVALLVGSMT